MIWGGGECCVGKCDNVIASKARLTVSVDPAVTGTGSILHVSAKSEGPDELPLYQHNFGRTIVLRRLPTSHGSDFTLYKQNSLLELGQKDSIGNSPCHSVPPLMNSCALSNCHRATDGNPHLAWARLLSSRIHSIMRRERHDFSAVSYASVSDRELPSECTIARCQEPTDAWRGLRMRKGTNGREGQEDRA